MQNVQTEQALGYARSTVNQGELPPERPIRELLQILPVLGPRPGTAQAATAPSPATSRRLASCCEASLRTIHLGLGALGQLVARSSLDLQDGSVPAESIENLGYLMSELGDLATECLRIASDCRQAVDVQEDEPACAA